MSFGALLDTSLTSLESFRARLKTLWETDHRPDGHHSDIYQHGRTAAVGEFKTMPYDATNFTASSSTWTVDLGEQTIRYMRFGPRANGTMVIFFSMATTDVGGTPTNLRFRLPEDCVNVAVARNLMQISNNGTIAADPGVALTTAGTNYVELYRDTSSTAWSTTAGDNTSVQGQIIVNVRDAQL